MSFTVADADWAARTRDSFSRQGLMRHLGAELTRLEPGLVEIAVAYGSHLTQQHGLFHAGTGAAIADSAGGYAGYTLYPATAAVLTVEFKLNLLAPARGHRLRAVGRVIKPGRTLTICDLEVYAEEGDKTTLTAKGLQTLIRLEGRPETEQRG